MIGMIYQVPVKYIYEDFQTIVTFNPIAVDWDTSLFLCEKIAQLDCVEEIIGGFYENTTRTAIRRVSEDGSIVMVWADNTKGARFTIYTTARGKSQTLKVAQKIKEILEIG